MSHVTDGEGEKVGDVADTAPSPADPGDAHENAAAEGIIPFTADRAAQFGITVAQAGPGQLVDFFKFPGQVRLNADRVANVTAPVSGIARKVEKNLGDFVHAGDDMAVLDSRELASARSAYYAARERVGLAKSNYNREKGLWEQKISSEQEYLEAKQALSEAEIEARSAGQQLRALGVAPGSAARQADADTRYDVRAPIDGSVIEKHVVLGESIQADQSMFVVGDLSTVWVDFNIYPRDLPTIRAGQQVAVSRDGRKVDAEALIAYLGPLMGEETQTALVRVVLPNEDGAWLPGQFVTGLVRTAAEKVPVAVPKDAVQTIKGLPSVFVQAPGGFEVRPVRVGRSTETETEIKAGLDPGETVAVTSTFVLKAEFGKSEAGRDEE